jgi:hypothetical protein
MTTQQTGYERLLAGLEDCRWEYMRLLADAAEGACWPNQALGWRWLAEERKWPRVHEGEAQWFRMARNSPTDAPLPHHLPAGAFTTLRRAGVNSGAPVSPFMACFDTVAGALLAAARAAGAWLRAGRAANSV